MKVKKLIEYLEEFDQDKEIELFELSDYYDTVLIAIKEDEERVILNIKNIIRNEGSKVEQ